ncbi:MAG: putative sulfate exporter family transporter [Desulfobacterales bacterium]|nr:putative sulfate exporter family transporter [Desulfobacterales bacterium]
MDLSRKERSFEVQFRKKLAMWPKGSSWLGIGVCIALTLAAAYMNTLPFPPFSLRSGQHPFSAVLLALLLGMILRNVIPASAQWKPGADTVIKKWLPVGIVLLGAGLDFYDLVRVAAQVMIGAVILVAVVILLSRVLTRWLNLNEKMGLLIGIGTAICGSSAILAAAPVINAREEDIAYSIGVINLLGVVAMLLFPVMGSLFAMDADVYGIWCGLSIHAMPQVIAAGFAHPGNGQTAGELATIVKLVRISLLGPTVFVLGVWFAYRQRQESIHIGQPVRYSKLVPGFVVLFLGMALLRTLGFLPEVTVHLSERMVFVAGDQRIDLARLFSQTGKWVITCAMAAVGMSTEFAAMKAGGVRTLALGVLAAMIAALLGLGIASL